MRKYSFRVLIYGFVLVVSTTSCSNYHSVLQKPKISDGITYGRKELPPSTAKTFYFKKGNGNIAIPELDQWADKKALRKYTSFDEFMDGANTSAFLVVRNDSIIFEHYYNDYESTDITQIFSVTKPITVSLLSEAIEEGRIGSVHAPVSDYLDIRRRKKKCKDLTLCHLGQMQSGLNHSDYWRWARIMRFYHSKNADHYIQKVKVFRDPGAKFRYKSIDTQVLGACMEKIFGTEDLTTRFIDLYWNRIGPENRGYYSIDHLDSGNPKYYGGLNLSAMDLAKIGKIYLNDGWFEGQQVINGEWMDFIQDTSNRVGRFDYCMGWYFDEMDTDRNVYYASGFNGQLLVINEDTNTIVIRMGEGKSGHEWFRILSELSTLF